MSSADVLVVGAGSTGAAIAWQLVQLGAGRVELLERRDVACGTTARSCAILRMHYTHELLTRMALHSRRVFEHFDDIVEAAVTFRRVGWLALARPKDGESLAANVEMHNRVGVNARLLTPDEAAELVPTMQTDDLGAAAWEPDSGYANPHASTVGFVQAAVRLGAHYHAGVTVDRLVPATTGGWRVETSEGPMAAGTVVVAAGIDTLDLVAPLGINLPVDPVRHTVAVVGPSEAATPDRPVISDRVVGSYYRPDAGSQTLVGATAPYDGHTGPGVRDAASPDVGDLARLAARFANRFRDTRDPIIQGGYTSIYDCSPDLQPLLGPVGDHRRLHIAVGFSGHGFKLAPAIGQMVAEKVLHGRSSLFDIEPFRPGRFDEGAAFVAPHAYSVPTLG
jgi:glycine/D-amino acid oxidase-like deaminating enzyme